MTTASPTTSEQRKPAVVLHAVVRRRKLKYPLPYQIICTNDGRTVSRHRNMEGALIQLRRTIDRAKNSLLSNKDKFEIRPAEFMKSANQVREYVRRRWVQESAKASGSVTAQAKFEAFLEVLNAFDETKALEMPKEVKPSNGPDQRPPI